MIPKNLLTIGQIQKAAETSDMAALKCSLKHWRQIEAMTYQEYGRTVERGKIDSDGMWCAGCRRWWRNSNCSSCPLGNKDSDFGCCGNTHPRFMNRVEKSHRRNAKAVADYIQKAIKNYKE